MIALGHPCGPSPILRAGSAAGPLAQAVLRGCRSLCWAGPLWGGKVGAAPCQERAEVGGSL